MKFAIGYQQPEHEPFPAMVADYRAQVDEVYFPWVGAPSGRAPLGAGSSRRDWQAQAILEEDLIHLREMGVRLDLLFNANCYGGDALSERLANEVCSIVDHLGDICNGPD
ncbi:MAG: hypothetical protein LC725_07300 [Lentisphaerae bacterium]|nr:hypothetical protein [Lentisphaerota bacterium]